MGPRSDVDCRRASDERRAAHGSGHQRRPDVSQFVNRVRMDILYQSDQGIQVALGSSKTEATFTFAPLANFLIPSSVDPNCADLNPTDTISVPNSNAFIDFDGDCQPDLFLTMNDGSNNYYRVFVQRII